MKNAAFFAPAFMHPETGDVLFYTGRAGAAYVSGNRAEAFFGYSEDGAQSQADKMASRGGLKGYVPFTVQHGSRVTNPTPRIKKSRIKSQGSQLTGDAPSARLIARRKKTAAQPMPGVWANPLTRVKVKSDPQRGGDMTPRLKTRRKTTQAAPEGFYANPAAPHDSEPLHVLLQSYVQWFNPVSGKWRTIAAFVYTDAAKKYAREWSESARGKDKVVRVWEE